MSTFNPPCCPVTGYVRWAASSVQFGQYLRWDYGPYAKPGTYTVDAAEFIGRRVHPSRYLFRAVVDDFGSLVLVHSFLTGDALSRVPAWLV